MAFAPSGSTKTFKIPCSGEGVFVAINQMSNSTKGTTAYWNGTSMEWSENLGIHITSITVQDSVATVTVFSDIGDVDELTRVCFIPGNPLASS